MSRSEGAGACRTVSRTQRGGDSDECVRAAAESCSDLPVARAIDGDLNLAAVTSDRAAVQPGQPAAPLGRGGRRRVAPRTVLAIASIGASVAFVDATIVNIAFPSIERSFLGTPISSLSWVLNAYNIVFAAFLVAAGRIADLLGRRRMFVLGLELFTFASLLCALAPTVAALIAFRALQALGAACLVPASLALVMHAFPPERRAHGVALLSAVAAAAAGLGPSLGGLLVAADDWRLVFLVNIPIGVAAVLLARRRLLESRAPGRRRMPDLLGAVVFALSVSAAVLAVVKGGEWGWTSAGVIGSFVAALALGGLFAWRCSWHRAPLVELSLLRFRTFTVANAMTIVAAAGFYGYTLANVLFLTGVWHYTVLKAGLAMTPGPFVAAAVARPTSAVAQRAGHRPVLVAGGLIWGAAVLWFVARVGARPEFLSEWLPGMALLGVGAGTLFPNLSGAAVASVPGNSFATATGLNSVARQVGAAMGVALVVAIIGTPSPAGALSAFDDAWRFGAACLFAAGLGCLAIGRLRVQAPVALAFDEGERPAHPLGARPAPAPARARAGLLPDAIDGRAGIETAPEFLACVPLFAHIDRGLLAALAERTLESSVGAGQWLFREGEAGDGMYVLRTGRLQVVDESSDAIVRELGRGDAVGELSLLSGEPRSASVRATRASDLLFVPRTEFEMLLSEAPELSLSLNRVMASQLRENRGPASAARPRPTTVALIGCGRATPVAEIATGLLAATRRHLDAELLRGDEGPSARAARPAEVYAPLLDRAELEHDMVLLLAHDITAPDAWSEFCIRQADRLLLIAAGETAPAELAERVELHGCDLVSYRAGSGSGNGIGSGALGSWARAVDPIESHVLSAATMQSDLERMARRLCGCSVGLVLSGGGARAFAHIGVLEELLAAGIQIDRVAGVSMGAFIGALFAMGLDPDEVDSRCFEEWVQRRPLSDLTLPRHGLIRGTRAEAMLRRTFGDVAIEELEKSFMCGCAELRSGRLVLARSGPLWEQVGFSICIPVLAPPQVRGRDLLIDGSLVDNLPVEPMAQMGEGPIIAVDVKATFDPARGDGSQPARAPRAPRTPTIGETLMRVLLLGSSDTSEAARRHADLLIKPTAEGVGLLEFHQIDAAREAGRAAAREALEASATSARE
jgi:NTE family protein